MTEHLDAPDAATRAASNGHVPRPRTSPDDHALLPLEVQGAVEAAPGHPAALTVLVRNTAAAPRVLLLGLVGLDPAWDTRPLRSDPLAPGESATLEVPVTPQLGTPPGRYPFVVSAQPLDPQTGRPVGEPAQADAVLEIGDAARLKLQVRPDEPDAVQTRRVAIMLDNRGSSPVTLELAATARPGLDVRIRQRTVQVPAASTVRVRARMTVQRRRLLGDPRRFPFTVSAQGHAAPIRFDGVFVARPFFSHTMARLMALVLVIAMWAGAAAIGLSKISSSAHQKTATAQAASGEGGGSGGSGSGGSGGGGSGGGGGAGGSGGGAGGGGGKTPAAPTARLTGTVTGPAPAGVTVTVEPTSLVDEAAEGASFVGVQKPSSGPGKLTASLVAYEAASVVSSKRSTTTQSDGAWAFAGLRAPGYYLLTFAKPGFQTVRYVVSAVAGADPVPLAVPLAAGAGHLSGKVSGPAGPLGGADITITDGTVTVTTSSATTGDVGAWSVDGLSTPDTYLVSASRDGFGLQSSMVTLGAGGGESVDLTLAPGVEALTGTVTGPDDTGHVGGIGGATVTATNGTVTRTATTVTTGPVGAYTLPDLPVPSTYTVTISAPGFAPQTQQVTLDGKQAQQAVDALLGSSTAVVTGTVTGTDGSGLVGAGLVLTGSSQTYKTMSVSNPAGSFRFTGVAPGDYVLSGELFAHVTEYAKVHVDVGNPSTVDLTLADAPGGGLPATAHIRGRIVDARTGGLITCPAGTSAGDCVVTVSTVDRRSTGDKPFSVTVAPGLQYLLPPVDSTNQGLLPGLHMVTFAAPGYESSTVAVQVTTGAVIDAPQVALSPAGTIEGSVTTRVGAFASGKPACVVIVPSDGGAPGATPPCTPDVPNQKCTTTTANAKCALVAADGSYALGDLDHGTYDVYVAPTDPDYIAPSAGQLTLAVGDTKRYDAVLDRFGVLDVSAYVPNGSGTPLSVVPLAANVTVTGTSSATANSVDSGTGVATFTHLQGTYTVHVSYTDSHATVYNGIVSNVPVGLNQTVPVSVVLNASTAQQILIGRVVTRVDGVSQPVAGVAVTVSGVTGFSGLVPISSTAPDVTTDSNGCFAITPDGNPPASAPAPCTGLAAANTKTLTLIGSQAQVAVAASAGQLGLSTTNVTFTSGSVLEIPVPIQGVAVSGQLQPTSANFSGAAVDVISRAPGAGPVSVVVSGTGALQWNDPTLAAGEAYPGTYKLQITVPGYDTLAVTVVVPQTGPYTIPAASLTLLAHGDLNATFASTDPTNHPLDAVSVVLSGTNITPVSTTTAPGSPSVTFPGLSQAAGPYTLTLRAAGFQPFTVTGITLTPAGTMVVTCASGGTATTCAAANDTSAVAGTPVQLTPGTTLSGSVVGKLTSSSSSAPLVGATVTATCTSGCSGAATYTTTTDSNGAFLITGSLSAPSLSDGTWTVTAKSTGYPNGTATATVDGTNRNTAVTVPQFVLVASTVDLNITVLSDLTTPLQYATVHLTNSTLAVDQTVGPTGVNGLAAFPGLAPTQYAVTVTATGYAPLSTFLTLPLGGGTQSISLIISARPNIVTGTVTGQRGAAVPTALSTALVSLTDNSDTSTVLTTSPDSNGAFEFANLADGSYTLTVSNTGYVDYSNPNVSLQNGQVVTANVNLAGKTFTVVATVSSTSGDSIPAGVSVTMTSTDSSLPNQTGVTDASGTATFNQVPWGNWTLASAATSGHLTGSGSLSIAATADTSVTQNVTVTISEWRLTIKATTSDLGTPTATITVRDGSTLAATTQLIANNSDATDLYLAGGATYTLTGTASGYDATSTGKTLGAITLPTVATTDSVLLTLTKTAASPAALEVDVTSGGNAVNGASVSVSGPSSPSAVTTGADGKATFSSLTAGIYTVTVSASGKTTQSVTVSLGAGDSFTLPVSLVDSPTTPATLTVTVTEAGSPVNGGRVTLSGGDLSNSQTLVTDASGNATFTGLTPGKTYTATAYGSSSLYTNSTSAPVVSGTQTISIETAGALTITASDTGTSTITSFSAQLTGPSPSTTVLTRSTTTGTLTISDLAPGSYTLVVTETGGTGRTKSTTATIVAGTVAAPATGNPVKLQ